MTSVATALRAALLLSSVSGIWTHPLQAQTPASHEVSLGLDTESAAYIPSGRHLFSGPLGRYGYNLSPRVAIEGNISYLFGYQKGEYTDEGRELLFSAGVKAGWRFRRVGVFGKIEPGLASYDNGIEIANALNTGIDKFRRTHFAVQDGAVLEYYPSQRTLIRFDVGQTVVTEFDQVLERKPEAALIQTGACGAASVA